MNEAGFRGCYTYVHADFLDVHISWTSDRLMRNKSSDYRRSLQTVRIPKSCGNSAKYKSLIDTSLESTSHGSTTFVRTSRTSPIERDPKTSKL